MTTDVVRTHCKHGHDLAAVGVYLHWTTDGKGRRYVAKRCRRCSIDKVLKVKARKRRGIRPTA